MSETKFIFENVLDEFVVCAVKIVENPGVEKLQLLNNNIDILYGFFSR
jgi:hypothetical protein